MRLTKPLTFVVALTLMLGAWAGPAATAAEPEPTDAADSAVVAEDPAVVAEDPAVVAEDPGSGLLPGAVAQPAPELLGLVNPDGSPFDLTTYNGQNTLLFFGYTHCPDVCPATIGELFGVFKAVPETQAVFVSVDPERDTPEFLTEWTQYFPENFDAVTGSPGAIRRAADNYGVKYARVETTSTSGYTMSHTADLYLIDESGQLLLAYPFGTPAAQIAADLNELKDG